MIIQVILLCLTSSCEAAKDETAKIRSTPIYDFCARLLFSEGLRPPAKVKTAAQAQQRLVLKPVSTPRKYKTLQIPAGPPRNPGSVPSSSASKSTTGNNTGNEKYQPWYGNTSDTPPTPPSIVNAETGQRAPVKYRSKPGAAKKRRTKKTPPKTSAISEPKKGARAGWRAFLEAQKSAASRPVQNVAMIERQKNPPKHRSSNSGEHKTKLRAAPGKTRNRKSSSRPKKASPKPDSSRPDKTTANPDSPAGPSAAAAARSKGKVQNRGQRTKSTPKKRGVQPPTRSRHHHSKPKPAPAKKYKKAVKKSTNATPKRERTSRQGQPRRHDKAKARK